MSTDTAGMQVRQYLHSTIHFLRLTISYNTTFIGTANTIEVGKLPAGSVIYDAAVKVNTAFNAGTTNLINVGTSADNDAVIDELDVDATSATFQSTRRGCDLTFASDTSLYVTFTQSGTAATAGEAEIIIFYIPDNDR